jgi:hypothetical protein
MRLEPYAAMAVLLALAACGGAGKKDEAKTDRSGAPAASAGAVATQLNPGEWEMTIDSSAMAIPGMPADALKAMKDTKVTHRQCITPEEARRPTADTFGGKNRGDCKQTEFTMAGGSLHAVTSCSGAGGKGGTTITTDGQFGGDSLDMRSKMSTDTGRGVMTVEGHVVGRRIGECKAGG